MSRAEVLALSLVTAFASAVIVPYVLDALGLGVMPLVTTAVAMAAGIAALRVRPAPRASGDSIVFASTVLVASGVLLWLARPQFLPPGGGPDLTHHLLLIDYIQQHGTLVHDPNAAAAIGEMASYTPGLHVLAVTAASWFHTDPLFAVYPVVAIAVALKLGVFALCLLRMLSAQPSRLLFALAGVALLFCVPGYLLGSIVHDSFLAQAVAELFAVAMWWALIVWNDTPEWRPMFVFAMCGVAAFLTWPIFLGPPVTALVMLMLTRTDLTPTRRLRQAAAALLPVTCVAAAHLVGRTAGLGLAGTSGAVSMPRVTAIEWSLLALAAAGLAISLRTTASRPLAAFTLAIGLQGVALWIVARRAGASTPYMALKMVYLAIYPLAGAAIIALSRGPRTRLWGAACALVLAVMASRQIGSMPPPSPTVSTDLWRAGVWAREHAPAACVDYLVGNAYTAYWLHLAVLRNPRAAPRSTDDRTYDTEASFARWLTGDSGAAYAIARLSVVPREIRDRTRELYRAGDAAVLARDRQCPPATAPGG